MEADTVDIVVAHLLRGNNEFACLVAPFPKRFENELAKMKLKEKLSLRDMALKDPDRSIVDPESQVAQGPRYTEELPKDKQGAPLKRYDVYIENEERGKPIGYILADELPPLLTKIPRGEVRRDPSTPPKMRGKS
jgi:hypothetical protein